MTERLAFFAPCPAGVEQVLAEELRGAGVHGVRPQRSGVLFSGRARDGLTALMWTRVASRVLLTLASVDATSADALYEAVRALPWEDHVRADGTIAVDATGVNGALRNTQFTAVKVKDAVADRFRERFGRRPSVDVADPDLRINVAVREKTATISIDLAGQPLHRRGYREQGVQVAAPMKETLAAAVLALAGWSSIAEKGGAFVDPMCGSGTLAIEAALAAGDVAPGLLRSAHPVKRWLGFDAHAWERVEADARRRQEAGVARLPVIEAFDEDPRAVEIAHRCVQRAGLEGRVRVERRRVSDLVVPGDAKPGLVATNPPWGERLSDRSQLPSLYRELAASLVPAFAGWRLAVVSPDPALAAGLGLESRSTRTVGSSKGAARLTLFEVGEHQRDLPPARVDDGRSLVVDAEPFANRLRKMSRHLGKWAKRSDICCYRIYDADLPDFAVAIDLYEGAGPSEGERWLHIAEYAPPAEIDPARAAARLDAAVAASAEVMGISAENVFVKRRERKRGSEQYERFEKRGPTGVVREGGLLFEVNLSDYLDTGLFLDHRPTRLWLGEMARGKSFLNLFAYTGVASVHAAAGGAVSTTTVDLSNTYIDWAKRNFALNDMSGDAHRFEQADVMDWLDSSAEAGTRFELIFCDPPTFSNSKRMDGTFDVQRDHLALLGSIEKVLAGSGMLVFSTNRRGFVLDEEGLLALGLKARDVSARTIPQDFERNERIHRCWTIERA